MKDQRCLLRCCDGLKHYNFCWHTRKSKIRKAFILLLVKKVKYVNLCFTFRYDYS